jgi:DNA-binding transcriptional MerR regulator
MLSEKRIFTPGEAAVVSGVPVKTVHREIDEGPLRPKRKKSGGKRSLREQDLFYLAVAKGLDTRLVQLTSEGKDLVK